MPGDDDFKRLEPEFLALARHIFDAGAQSERERMVAFLQGGGKLIADANVLPRVRRRARGDRIWLRQRPSPGCSDRAFCRIARWLGRSRDRQPLRATRARPQ